jgi:DNA-binding NarL/FixJ family response regulator
MLAPMTARKTPAAAAPKRLLIVDDHPMMREGLAQLINHVGGLTVCGEAGTGREGLDLAAKLKPDLVLADISLPDTNGLEVVKNIRAMFPAMPVLVISMHDESMYAERVLRAGGRGYIMKQEGGKKLLEAIQRVLSGQVYVSEKMSATLLGALSGQSGQGKTPIAQLSDREFEVLQLMGQGKGTRAIAAQLGLSIKTVETHRASIKTKLKLTTATELVHFAVRWVETK